MARSVAELEKEIRSLDAADKVELLRALIEELDGPADSGVEEAWLAESQRRYDEIVSGEVKPITGERVMEELQARFDRQRKRTDQAS